MFDFAANYRKYGSSPSSHDIYKFIAIIIMIIDHTGHFFFHDDLMWRAIGRIGFPIWFFFAGYARPGKIGKEIYILAGFLILVDLIAHQPLLPVNALVTILACRYLVSVLDKKPLKKWQSFYYILGLTIWMPLLFLFEYGTMGLMFALFGYLAKIQPKSLDTKISAIFATIIFLVMQNVNYEFGFTAMENIIMYGGTSIAVYYLYHFRLYFLASPNNITPLWMRICMFLGRNSLYIYVIHLTLFVVIVRFLHPEAHQGFRWF